jgi:RimJ/RimL family protein N-acetyltransferase
MQKRKPGCIGLELRQFLQRRHSGLMICGSMVVMVMLLGCNKAKNQNRRSIFVPLDFNVPVVLERPRFKLRPIQQTDARLDYEAVMSSAQQLRIQFDDDWPTDNFSIEENQNQLAIHEQQFVNRTAFVYTVLRPDESQVLGCVYIYPDETRDFDAIVTYWVRETKTVGDLPQKLRSALEIWLKTEWPFQTVKLDGPQ